MQQNETITQKDLKLSNKSLTLKKQFYICAGAGLFLLVVGLTFLLKEFETPALAPAAIPRSISITMPQGTEEWQVGTKHTIEWDSIGVEKVRISSAVGGKDLGTTQEIDAVLGIYTDFVVPDVSGFGKEPPYEVTIFIFDVQNQNISDTATFTAIWALDMTESINRARLENYAKYMLEPDEIPAGFELSPISGGEEFGFSGNPGFFPVEEDTNQEPDYMEIQKFFYVIYSVPSNRAEELGVYVINWKISENLSSEEGEKEWGRLYGSDDSVLLRDGNNLIVVWADPYDLNEEVRFIADKLKARLGLAEIWSFGKKTQ